MNFIQIIVIIFAIIIYSCPFIVIATLSVYFADKFIKKEEGKKVLYKVPIYITLGSLLISFIVFIFLGILSIGEDPEFGFAMAIPLFLTLISITIAPILSFIVTSIVYYIRTKNKV